MAQRGAFGRRHPYRAHRPRRLVYPLLGLVLALAAPSGLLVVRSAEQGRASLEFWVSQIALDPVTYLYLVLATGVTFVLTGFLLGRRADQLRELATHDALTGLANRGAFERRLEDEIFRAVRYGTSLSLLLIDVDGLKQINDRFGHAGGDRTLKQIGETLAGAARRSDLAARVGGDEFAILAPETPAPEARELAERVRALIAALEPLSDGMKASVSIGVADLDGIDEGRAEKLLNAADEELYAAKAAGKNRTSQRPMLARVVSEPQEVPP